MSPLPVPKHQRIAASLSIEFGTSLKRCKNCNVYQPIDYKVSDDIVIQPDLLIVCNEIKKKFLDFPPSLVIEILSPSTALKDRHSKFEIYQQQQIKYYLIISPDTDEAEVYEYLNDSYQLKEKGKSFGYTFSFPPDCFADINFNEI